MLNKSFLTIIFSAVFVVASPFIAMSQTLSETKGVAVEFVYTSEFVSISDGAKETDGTLHLNNIDFTVTLDTGEAGWWDGGTLFFYGLSNSGDDPSEYVGDMQVTSNIEAYDSTRVMELWYEQAFGDGGFAVLVGLHDLNSEFYTSDYAGLFFNSSFGIGPSLSANAPVSIFNVSAPVLRVKLEATESLTVLAAIYDGDPGAPDVNDNGLKIEFDIEEEGLMSIGEIQFAVGGEGSAILPGVYRIGAWSHSAEFEEFSTGEPIDGDYGFYVTLDQMLLTETAIRDDEEGTQGLGIFGQFGWAPGDRNEVALYFGAGFNYTGLLPFRDEDVFGIATAYAVISDDLIEVEKAADGLERTYENVIEFTYMAMIKSWFIVQLDYQMVINPSADPDVDTVSVISTRVQIVF